MAKNILENAPFNSLQIGCMVISVLFSEISRLATFKPKTSVSFFLKLIHRVCPEYMIQVLGSNGRVITCPVAQKVTSFCSKSSNAFTHATFSVFFPLLNCHIVLSPHLSILT